MYSDRGPAGNCGASFYASVCCFFNYYTKKDRDEMFFEKNRRKPLTNTGGSCIIYFVAAISKIKRHFGSIAQLGEHLPYKQRVTGSSPVVPTNFIKWRGSSVG